MAVNDIKGALQSAASTVTKYLEDASTLSVTTSTLEAGSGDKPVLAASTVIKLDGDNTSVVPARQGDDGAWVIETTLYDLHMRNVEAAIDYRSKLMGTLLDLLRST